MSKYVDAEFIRAEALNIFSDMGDYKWLKFILNREDVPSIDIVFCRECKHRPIKEDPDGEDYGFNIIKPNGPERCPCLVEDGWYSWMPKDNFFCGYGEREDE